MHTASDGYHLSFSLIRPSVRTGAPSPAGGRLCGSGAPSPAGGGLRVGCPHPVADAATRTGGAIRGSLPTREDVLPHPSAASREIGGCHLTGLRYPENTSGLRESLCFPTAAQKTSSLFLPPAARGCFPPAGGRLGAGIVRALSLDFAGAQCYTQFVRNPGPDNTIFWA